MTTTPLDSTLCDLTDLPAYSCACRRHRNLPDVDIWDPNYVNHDRAYQESDRKPLEFQASHRSDCPRCPDPILPDQIITRVESGEYVHVDCAG
jgi:hypothetical protein